VVLYTCRTCLFPVFASANASLSSTSGSPALLCALLPSRVCISCGGSILGTLQSRIEDLSEDRFGDASRSTTNGRKFHVNVEQMRDDKGAWRWPPCTEGQRWSIPPEEGYSTSARNGQDLLLQRQAKITQMFQVIYAQPLHQKAWIHFGRGDRVN